MPKIVSPWTFVILAFLFSSFPAIGQPSSPKSEEAVFQAFVKLSRDLEGNDPAVEFNRFVEENDFTPEELGLGLKFALKKGIDGAWLAIFFETYLAEKTKDDEPRIRASKALAMADAGDSPQVT